MIKLDMHQRRVFITFIEVFLCLIFVATSVADGECDKTKCQGPLAYYDSLKCKPIYKNPGDCCGFKYDCSHLEKRSKSKCYRNNNIYEIGDKLKEEDSLPCDIGCVCREGISGVASCTCSVVDCFQPPPKPGCYRDNTAAECCPGEEICPEEPEEGCVVDGKTYKRGEYFQLKDKPDTSCYCKARYKECDKTKCRGPLAYYDDLKCKPIYKNPGDCCAIKYDCSHLEAREKSKCYRNDNVYEIGEALKEEDARPCDIGCSCREGYLGLASFTCAIVDCFNRAKPGCYLDHSENRCCPGPEICPEKPVSCIVDGETYQEGAFFQPKDKPDTYCYCKPGYKGENVPPFCHTPKGSSCGTELRHSNEIHQKCAPAYYSDQPPQTSCSVSYRCQNNNDTLISHPELREGPDADKTNTCLFGNIVMHIGDELNQATDYSSVCVKCTCEVPPVPTCQRLPDNECDVTVHPPFN